MVVNNKKYNFNNHSPELSIYLEKISKKYESLSREEEKYLALRIKKGDEEAFNKLVNCNLLFVVSVAKKYQNQGLSLVDLISEGSLGLMEAAKRFSEKKKVKFISYAVWWIRQQILQGLGNYSRITNIPMYRIAHKHKIEKIVIKLEQKHHHEPCFEEISEELGITEKNIKKAMEISNKHSSFDAPLPGKGPETTPLYGFYYDENQEKTDDKIMQESTSELVEKILSFADEREREVLKLRHELEDGKKHTLKEIGTRKGLSVEGVRQIEKRAKKKIKNSRAAKELFNSAYIT